MLIKFINNHLGAYSSLFRFTFCRKEGFGKSVSPMEKENEKYMDLDTINLLRFTKSLQQTMETLGLYFFSQEGRENSFNLEVSQPALDF